MKTNVTLIAMLCIALNVFNLQAQNSIPPLRGGEVLVPQNSEPCLTENHRNQIKAENRANIAQLRAEGTYLEPNRAGGHPLFIWPVAQADGHDYNNIYSLTNYVDHNPTYPNQISDYDCGTRSYDTTNGYNHKGFDIISWPFWWKQMDLNQAVNVAAADGQIINKNDGSFDRNCSFNNDTPNYIAVQHNDGSVAWYLHMKDGGLTSKNIGDSVNVGEFLGVIGSSGSSTLPHLHFEVYDSMGELIDPSVGDCNALNNDTWWLDQKPYYEPGVNAALTHTDFPNFENCPTTEITNESDQFSQGDDVFYAIYLKDQQANTQVHLKLSRPDNSIQYEWDHDLAGDSNIVYYVWSFPVDMDGQWTWEATYFNSTATHIFNVGELGIEDDQFKNTKVYPNPLKEKLFISSESSIVNAELIDILGRSVFTIADDNIENIDVDFLKAGVYFLSLTSSENKSKTIKLIKN